ncbi:hypothetical protein BCD64_06865 [Nostoc sp. MBR 210]|nr:hypothetical protein BCD64_06865 [Nostoc sp. MBR 210]
MFFMPLSIYDIPSDIGKTLSDLRKAAKKKQADIAKSLNVAQSHVSRIEKGKVTPTGQELEEYVKAIGTEEAQYYLKFLKPWEILKRPSFRNPQRDNLWKAETSLKELQKLISEDAPDFLIRQAEMYDRRVREEAEYLTSLEHSIAFTGPVGVGKTTAICKLTGLLIPQEKQIIRQSVLAVGTGRTTVCEVGIRGGEKFGIRIKPQSLDEINKLVEDLYNNNNHDSEENPPEIISLEVQRLLFNMAGLNGKAFADLVQKHENLDTLRLNFLEMLNLQERTREEICFEANSNQIEIEWLKETFKQINYGNHKEFSVPQRVDIIVPSDFFNSSSYELEVIDTRGLDKDGTAVRRDLMECLSDPRALTVLCSRFKDAPSSEIFELINNLIQTGSEKLLKERVIILVLPQNDEAYNATNNAGDPVDSKDEAYSLKCEEIRISLKSLVKEIDVNDIPILFFNAKPDEDNPSDVAKILIEKLDQLRYTCVQRLSSSVDAINILIKNQKEKNAREAYERVSKSLEIFLNNYQNKLLFFGSVHQKTLIPEMRKTHSGTLRAAIRRNGKLDKFDVYFLLGNGSRSVAWNATMSIFHELKGILKNLSGDDLIKEYAAGLITQILANWDEWHQDFLDYSEQISEQIFKPHLIKSYIWDDCMLMKGSGFRNEVISKFQGWFNAYEQRHLHELLNAQIEKAWQEKVLGKLGNLIGNVTTS